MGPAACEGGVLDASVPRPAWRSTYVDAGRADRLKAGTAMSGSHRSRQIRGPGGHGAVAGREGNVAGGRRPGRTSARHGRGMTYEDAVPAARA